MKMGQKILKEMPKEYADAYDFADSYDDDDVDAVQMNM